MPPREPTAVGGLLVKAILIAIIATLALIATIATLALIAILVFLFFGGGRIGPNPGVGPPGGPEGPGRLPPAGMLGRHALAALTLQ